MTQTKEVKIMTELEMVFDMDYAADVAVMDNETARKRERRLELFRELDILLRKHHSQTSKQDWIKAREIVTCLFRDSQ
jgi:hypothetical protein